jgi:mannose-binding lectin
MAIYYAQTSGAQQTNSGSATPMPGLSVTVPEGVGVTALVILNVPNPYAEGINFPGAQFGITVNGAALPAMAAFTSGSLQPISTGRVPTTLVAQVPLAEQPQTVAATWQGVRGSTVIIDSPASLSAIVA